VTNQDFIEFFANDVIQNMVMTGEKEKFDEIVNKMPSRPVPNKFYRNKGGLQFAEEGEAAGLGQPSFSNGSAYGDLDNDGDLDLIVNNVNSPVFVYKNESREINKNNYIALQLKGERDNRFAVGSKIIIYQGNQLINRELIPTRGFQSSIDYKLVIGLGKGQIDSMIIKWPDRRETRLLKPAINQLHIISIEAAKQKAGTVQPLLLPWFEKTNTPFEKHREDDYIDFYTERNIPVMLSREGPHADTADVNKDGLTDLFIGGAAGQAGMLYVQTKTGFGKSPREVFEKDRAYEDVAVLFFDADLDGDKDLFIGAGGNALEAGNILFQHRLYVNDGKGNFSPLPGAFPPYAFNAAAAVAFDADGDGDMDLFLASRSIPQHYGMIPESYLYINDSKGKFSVGASVKAGMLTDAALADVDRDTKNEIIVTGEWMAPIVFAVKNNQLIPLATGVEDYKGWWQSVTTADIDGDGDIDCIFGNTGENCYLKPGKNNPVKLWISDFDQNGTDDKIITRTINKRDVPVFLKRELTEQMPSLKKQNLKYEEYAGKSIQDLFSRGTVNKATVQEFNYAASSIAVNNGKGSFVLQELPVYTQFSSINAICCTDLNNDGKKDLVMGGNQFYFQPQFARLDASYGHILINKGSRNGKVIWEWAAPSQTGFETRGEVKDILLLPSAQGSRLLVVENDNYPVLFRRTIQ